MFPYLVIVLLSSISNGQTESSDNAPKVIDSKNSSDGGMEADESQYRWSLH